MYFKAPAPTRVSVALPLERCPHLSIVVRRRACHDIARRRRGYTFLAASVCPRELDVSVAACRLLMKGRLCFTGVPPGLYRVATDTLLVD